MKRWKLIFCAAVCLVVYLAVCMTGLMGCMSGSVNENGNGTDKTLISSSGIENEGRLPEPEEMIAILEKCCKDLYQKALETGTVGDLTVVRSMVERLGEEGYVVIDQDNQVDMENAPVLEVFCEKVEQKQAGNVMFLMVLNNGGVVQFRMETEDGGWMWWRTVCGGRNRLLMIQGKIRTCRRDIWK